MSAGAREPRYAPARESDGLKPYVVTTRSVWDRGRTPAPSIRWAENAAAARSDAIGRQSNASAHARRATPADMREIREAQW